jgi:hypothetical protein
MKIHDRPYAQRLEMFKKEYLKIRNKYNVDFSMFLIDVTHMNVPPKQDVSVVKESKLKANEKTNPRSKK